MPSQDDLERLPLFLSAIEFVPAELREAREIRPDVCWGDLLFCRRGCLSRTRGVVATALAFTVQPRHGLGRTQLLHTRVDLVTQCDHRSGIGAGNPSLVLSLWMCSQSFARSSHHSGRAVFAA